MISFEPLYRLLKERRMTIGEVSERIGFDSRSLSSIAARHQNIRTGLLGRICDYLHCKPSQVIEFVDEVPDHQRVCFKRDWRETSQDYIKADWNLILKDIEEMGYTECTFSKKLNKANNYITLRKHRAFTKKDILKLICSVTGREIDDYIQ